VMCITPEIGQRSQLMQGEAQKFTRNNSGYSSHPFSAPNGSIIPAEKPVSLTISCRNKLTTLGRVKYLLFKDVS
jgi:hypothetical protein